MEPEQLQKMLGERARAARERLGLTQAQVARQLGIAPAIYGRIERGGMLPAVPTLRKMTLALGMSSDVLLSVERADVAPSTDTLDTGGDLTPELRSLMSMLRTWSPAKLKRLIRVLSALENAPEDE
jgi:transcriptional regulator with XRE-family HTH domain